MLLAQGYGALSATLFAATHPQLVHSALYLNPIPPELHYVSQNHSITHSLRFFLVDVLGSFASELGLVRIWSTLTGSSRATRVLSTESKGLRAEIMRSFVQEESEAHNPSGKSAKAWTNARTRYPERPTIVLSRKVTKGNYEYGQDEWVEGQASFVRDTVGRGLEEWDKEWEGTCGAVAGDACRESLLRLVRMD